MLPAVVAGKMERRRAVDLSKFVEGRRQAVEGVPVRRLSFSVNRAIRSSSEDQSGDGSWRRLGKFWT